jgi:DNA-binding GntR family transcriptional regulator
MPISNLSLEKSETLSNKIYNLLKNQIIKGNLEPGERLVIEKIANELEVSTTPVRDALQLLIYAGYAIKKDNSSIFVIKLSKADVNELFDIREVLEGLGARLLTEELKKEDKYRQKKIKILEGLLQTFEQKKKKLIAREEFISHELDVELHNLLLDLSTNKRLRQQVNKIINQSYRIRELQHQSKLNKYLNDGKIERTLQETNEHIQIIETILSGNSEYAENEMRKHIQNSKKDIFKWVNIPEWQK